MPTPNDLTADQIEALLSGEAELAPDAAPPAPEPEQPVEAAPVEDDSAPVEDDATPSEQVEEAAPEPDPKAELERLRAALEQAQSRAKHFESLAGRHAGKVGYLTQLLERKGVDPTVAGPEDEDGIGLDDDDSGESVYELRSKLETYFEKERAEDRDRAIVGTVAKLKETGLLDGVSREDIAAVWARHADQFSHALDDQDPELVRATVVKIVTDARETALNRAAQMANTRRVASMATRQGMKVRAAISGTGGTPSPRPGPRSYEQMSVDELEAEIQRELAR